MMRDLTPVSFMLWNVMTAEFLAISFTFSFMYCYDVPNGGSLLNGVGLLGSFCAMMLCLAFLLGHGAAVGMVDH
jgi:hypothetical protein